jgi:ClpP class serine protease
MVLNMKNPNLITEIGESQWAMTQGALTGLIEVIDGHAHIEEYYRFRMISNDAQVSVLSDLGELAENTKATRIKGGVGSLFINGPIIPRSSFLSELFGLTSVESLSEEFQKLEANEKIKNILLVLDTPGGAVNGISDFAKLISASQKPITAYVLGMAASAGYWIASAANEIVSTDTGIVGSIGTVLSVTARKDGGRVNIVSNQSPRKNVGELTKANKKDLQALVDGLSDIFIEAVARNRGISKKKVLSDYGKGAVFVAQEAERREMIDRIDTLKGVVSSLVGAELLPDDVQGEIVDISAGTTTFKDYQIVDKPWDSTSAVRRIRKATGSTKQPSASYKEAFFWYDPKNTDNFGGYKLPFVDIVDGGKKAVRRAVFAAKGAMGGARGGVQIPSKDRASVLAHINRYVSKIEKQDQKAMHPAGVVVTKTKEDKMKLADLIAEDPTLAKEVKVLQDAAFTEGVESEKKKIAAVVPYLSNESYPRKLIATCCKVLNGDLQVAALHGAIGALDMLKAEKDIEAAQEETDETGDTPAQVQNPVSEDGMINSEEDFEAAVAAARAN